MFYGYFSGMGELFANRMLVVPILQVLYSLHHEFLDISGVLFDPSSSVCSCIVV